MLNKEEKIINTPNFLETEKQVNVWKYMWDSYRFYLFVYIGFFVFVLYFLASVLSVVILLCLASIGYWVASDKVKKNLVKEFGKSIGFSYTEDALMDSVSGRLFNIGTRRWINKVLNGVYKNIPIRFFNYFFQNGRVPYWYVVFEVTLPVKVPSMSLLSRSKMVPQGDLLSENKTVDLEGDFNKFFKLRVPEEYKQEALNFFSSDILMNLARVAPEFSVEFNNDRIYIYTFNDFKNKSELQHAFDVSKELLVLFCKKLEVKL